MSYGACSRCGNAHGECECGDPGVARLMPEYGTDLARLALHPERRGVVKLALVPRKGYAAVHVQATWRSGHTETWYLPKDIVLDGTSARRIERGVNTLIEERVLTTTEMLAALGFRQMEKAP